MSFAKKYNRVMRWDIDTEGFQFIKLRDLYMNEGTQVYTLRGLYIHKSKDKKYKDNPVAIIDGYFVNLPSHLTAIVRDMLEDGDTLSLIRAGKAGFRIYEYESDGGTYYSVYWVDIE